MLKNVDFLKKSKTRVLVIDDTQKNLEVVGQLLSGSGFDVSVTNNGERGIAIARKMIPDIILLDIMMPDVDGYEVCRRLKADELTVDIPVVFLTAKTDQEDLLLGFEAGAVDYITKPFVKDELLARVGVHSEVAVRRRQEAALTNILNKYVLEMLIDTEGVIRHVSEAFLELTKYAEGELVGQNIDMLKHPDVFRSFTGDILDALSNNYSSYREVTVRTKAGGKCILNIVVEPIATKDGAVVGAQCYMTDVTSKKELEYLSVTDKLTGLFNRQKLDEVLNYEFNLSTRYGSSFSVILLDLDNFKAINDNFGHLFGDNVLIKVSEILKKSIRDCDTAGRWGGEEFLVVLPKTSADEAHTVAEKLRKSIENCDFEIDRVITASMGVASTDGKTTILSLLSYADKGLYEAKRTGKNKAIIFNGE